jgi:DNA-binding MarR family transcriptional regulator
MDDQAAGSIVAFSRILSLLFHDSFTHNYLAGITPRPLPANQFSILKILKISGSFLVSEIAGIIQLSHAAASKTIDIWVNHNLVSRRIPSKDRRKASVSLLMSGEKIVQEFETLLCRNRAVAKESLTKRGREQVFRLLSKYVQQLLVHEKRLDFICVNCTGDYSDECALLKHNIHCRFKCR